MESENNPENQNAQDNPASIDDVNIEMKDINNNDDANNQLSSVTTSADKVNINDPTTSEQKNDDSEEINKKDKPSDLKELLPWIIIACVGVLLFLIACIIFATSGETPKQIVIPTLKLPQIHGVIKVTEVDGKELYYKKSLRHVVNSEAKELAVKLRPKIKKVYLESGVPADSILVLAFKYKDGKSEIGDNPGVFVSHWVYLKNSEKIKVDSALIAKVKSTASAKAADIGLKIDSDSINLLKTENMTQQDAIRVLSQHNFLKNGLADLDTTILGAMGIMVQAEDDEGFCAAFDDIDLLVTRSITPATECMDTDLTYPGLKCTFACREGYILTGSAVRYCLPDGTWSGQAAFCEATCEPLNPAPFDATFPSSCGSATSASGQFCFTQCPSSSVLMVSDDNVDDAVTTSDEYHVRQCRNGQWINGPGLCVEKCPMLTAPQHSTFSDVACSSVRPFEGTSCSVVCDSGYSLPGGGNTQQVSCNMGGTWSDGLIDCIKTCSGLVASANLAISPSLCTGTPYDGTMCNFQCADGYTLQGHSYSVCDSDGSWSHTVPTCVQHCNTLPTVMNGRLTSDTGDCQNPVHGTKCSLICDSGFIQSNDDTTCTNGAWTNNPTNFKCLRSCPPLSTPNGSWSPAGCSTGSYDLSDDSCTLTCNSNYSPVGSSSVTCNTNSGFWKSEPAVCKKLCAARVVSANLKVYPASCASPSEAGLECKFYCDPMYELTSGPTTTTCSDGTWSNSAIPTCSANAAKEYVVKSVFSGSTAPYCLVSNVACSGVEKLYDMTQCQNGGVRLDGPSDQFFKNTWTTNDGLTIKSTDCGKCISHDGLNIALTTCDSLSDKQKFNSGSLQQIHTTDDKILSSTFHTHDPPFFSNLNIQWNTQWSFTYNNAETTTLDGTRNNKACQQTALEASIIDRTDMTISVSGTSATISCGASKQLSESSQSSVTCTDGLWDVSRWLHCYSTSSQCSDGSISLQTGVQKSDCSTTVGGYCKLSCSDSNQYVIGPKSISCITGGRWQSQEISYCKSFCPSLTAPTNGYFIGGNSRHCTSGRAKVGDSCDVACEVGYALQGSRSLTCNPDGAWFTSVPTCVKMCQMDVKKIDNVKISGCTDHGNHMYMPGSSCSISCPHGYGLSPVNNQTTVTVTCSTNSTWDKSIPECVSTCSPIVESATYSTTVSPSTCSTPIAGMACNISCGNDSLISDGVAVFSSVTRTCTNSRLWNGYFDVCRKYCPAIDRPASGVVGPSSCTTTYQQPGSVCTLYCAENHVASGATVATCTQHGNWSYSNGNSTFGQCLTKCPALERLRDTTISPKSCVTGPVEPGTDCEITCPAGFTRVGAGVMTCNGFLTSFPGISDEYTMWSNPGNPHCKAVCPPIVPTPHIAISPFDCSYMSRLSGDKCSFQCQRNYVLAGPETLQCLGNGEWSNTPPSCQKFCPALKIPNGYMYCDRSLKLSAPGYGEVYRAGTWCTYKCHEGYVANQASDIACTHEGSWSPAPYCVEATSVWPIFQHEAAGDKTKCMSAIPDTSFGWEIKFLTSSTACSQAGGDATWTWYKGSHLRHTATGLCLTAKVSRAGSGVWLTHCEDDYKMQMWSCDVVESYRIVLKNTSLGLISTYSEAGPILSAAATKNTFWVAFNEDLEGAASICSVKTKGICPPITGNNFVASPSICASDDVEVWQKCVVSCDDASFSPRGPSFDVQCTPKGVWKGISDVKCIPKVKCPAYSRDSATTVTPEICYSSVGVDHGVECKSSCTDGYTNEGGPATATAKCTMGNWVGQTTSCKSSSCEPGKLAPVNGAVDCSGDDCTITCNVGYVLTDDSYSKRKCDGTPVGNMERDARFYAMGRSATPQPATQAEQQTSPVSTTTTTTSTASGGASSGVTPSGNGPFDKCEVDRGSQFMIKLQTASIQEVKNPCLTNSSDRMATSKAACSKNDLTMFWKWDYNRLQHVVTGKCLAIHSTTDELILISCANNVTEEWYCSDVNNPYHIFALSDPSSYIDAGSANLKKSARMRSAPFYGSGRWFGVDAAESLLGSMLNGRVTWPSTVCSYKAEARCPTLSVGPYSTASPSGCGSNAKVGDTCTFTCNSDYTLSPSQSILTCKSNGLWDHVVPACVYKDTTSACPSLSLDRNVIAEPGYCYSSDTVKKGSICHFKCKHGYIVDGNSEISCNGTWSSAAPSCKALCSNLIHPHHVAYDNPSCDYLQVKESTSCAQSCDTGYVAPHATAKTCLASGEWDLPNMKCTRGCPNLLGAPYNATTNATLVIQGTHNVVTSERCVRGQLAGEYCSFSCPNTDYSLVDGPAQQQCLSDSSFLYPIAQCVKTKFCPDIVGTGVSSVSYSPKRGGVATDVGTVATITCSTGYTAAEGTTRVCQADGSWSGSNAYQICEKLCPPLQKSIGLNYKTINCTTHFQKEGATCVVSCSSNLVATSTTATCSSGTWDVVPQCTLTTNSVIDSITILDNAGAEFQIILSHRESNGHISPKCLKRIDNRDVLWVGSHLCDHARRENRWKWSGKLISHVDDNLCLKIHGISRSVILATCNQTDVLQQFGCGSTNAFQRFTLQPVSTEWMITTGHYLVWRPPNGYVYEMKARRINSPYTRDHYSPVAISANEALADRYANNFLKRYSDTSVCSFSCGGSFRGTSGQVGYIISPGYRGYATGPSFVECHWSLYSLGYKTTVTVTELQLEDSSNNNDGCGLDCLEIFEAFEDRRSNARQYREFRGNDLSIYNPAEKGNALVTTTGNVYVRFKTNTISSSKGFIIRFEYEDEPQQPKTCGMMAYNQPNIAFGSYPTSKALDIAQPQSKSHISKDNVWPWVVSIREVDSRNGIHRCSGILIDNSTIISAAHCANFMLRTTAHNINTYVSVNITNQYYMDDEWKLGIKYKIDRVFVHPQYDAAKRLHDIAVWKISAKSPIMLPVPPPCLAFDDYLPFSSISKCYAVGWSPITKGPTLHLLKEYEMAIESPYWCKSEFGLSVEEKIICARFDGLDASGSLSTDDSEPLLCQRGKEAIYFVGVAAYTHVGRYFNRRVYTSINAERNWLSNILSSSELTMASQGFERLVLTEKDQEDYHIINRNDMKWKQFF